MKVLVAVASKHGSTREIGQAITEELQAAGVEADLRNAIEVDDVAGYEAIVLGSAIYVGGWMSEAQRFAEWHYIELSDMPVWLFSSGPLGSENPQPQSDPAKLSAVMGDVQVRDHRIFAGNLDLAALGFGERLLAQAVRVPVGDFREWSDIREWARGIATELQSENATSLSSIEG